VRTNRRVNVGGNWQTSGNLWGSIPLNKQRNLSLSGSVRASYARSTDLSLSSGETRSSLSHVGIWSLSSTLSLNCNLNSNVYLYGSVYANYQNVQGDRSSFEGFNMTYIAYNLIGSFNLPWELHLQTDCRIVSRYGMSDTELNDTRILWNASLSRTVKALTFTLKGCDLFGRNRYTSVAIDSQGRTETFANTLPPLRPAQRDVEVQ